MRPTVFTSLLIAGALLTACSDVTATSPQSNARVDEAPPSEVIYPISDWAYGLPAVASEFSTGGQGGEIVRVTSLASRGPGTLREALSRQGPRQIVFDIAGIIDLGGDNISIEEPFVTVAGQTAPSPGITIIRGGLIIRGHDVIIQHLRIRSGDLNEGLRSGRDIDAITTIGAHNVVIDHCSLSWATDENLSASGPRFTGDTPDDWRKGTSHRILFSNNIVAEGLANSTHAKGEHSKGSLIHDNVSDILIYANIYSSNYERSPLFKGGVRGAIVNNYIYNPGQRAIQYNLQGLEWGDVPPETGQMDVVSNVMKAGPSTAPGLPLVMIGGIGDLSLHMESNLAYDRWGAEAPILGRYTSNASAFLTADAAHHQWQGLSVLPAVALEPYVLSNSGARPWDRDVNDVRVLADLAEGRGSIIDSQDQVGGYPSMATKVRAFNPDHWNLDTLAPVVDSALDSGEGSRGT